MAEENEAQEEEQKKGGKGKLILFGGIGLVLVVGGVFAGPMIQNMLNPPAPVDGEEPVEVITAKALYYPILPPLTTNFSDEAGRRRFMQVSLEVRARDHSVINAVKDHSAVIRNALLMAYSDVGYAVAITREGKEALRVLSLTEVQRVLTEETGEPGIDDIFFTSFIVQ